MRTTLDDRHRNHDSADPISHNRPLSALFAEVVCPLTPTPALFAEVVCPLTPTPAFFAEVVCSLAATPPPVGTWPPPNGGNGVIRGVTRRRHAASHLLMLQNPHRRRCGRYCEADEIGGDYLA